MQTKLSDHNFDIDLTDKEFMERELNLRNVEKQKHYASYKIQPMEFIGINKIGFIEGNIIKYVARYSMKNGIEDLRKARHYLDKLIEREETGKITLESV